ncbi:MAG: phospho-N-acetylmuramoyl-pentapeptide-transferase [Candidatus Cellulosilyticum pullistercoris]|uniref:Phospho-N-acetylmuramoyl-pentapeptide-transferase n=1 Tax=Candidatus Cellulosilyticum pullistercoris TaxID=2838521 RepID=A0A9E2KAY0_9FIRM|nr:phospho-N-acetylmuramoyl-pentapeptide-transferase [Candidatus Cellulosilyticum pullistercoris]
MKNEAVYAILIAFFLNIVISPFAIPLLHKLKFGQNVRDDGPNSHLKKAGTPTMGGIIILASIIITTLFFVVGNREVQTVLFVTVGFGVIGFLDDYIKVVKKRSLGLTPMQKIIAQLIVTCIFAYLLSSYVGLDTAIIIPFTGGKTWDMGLIFWPFLVFVVLAVVNAVNLTDGVDGLASSVTVLVATFFAAVAMSIQSAAVPIAAATVGSLLGFLLFNSYPAKVFMGDTGSLALGGFVVAIAFVLKMPLFILIVGIIYVAENVSVILQVAYFKRTKKRLFRMAPIHHHFELGGWPETKVVTIFSIITAIMCLVGLIAL